MAQHFTHLLNHTITGVVNADPNLTFVHSVSVRLTGLCKGSYVKLYGVSWNATCNDDGGLGDVDFFQLLILRNEIFDARFNYRLPVVENVKDVIWRDSLTRNQTPKTTHRNFVPSWKLNDASNYLIIVNPPVRLGDTGLDFQVSLTVRGIVYDCDDENTFAARKR